jgi:signal transduction histidine kinase
MVASTTHVSFQSRLQQVGTAVYAPLLVAVAYYLGAEAAFYIGTLSDRIFAPFWPPNIVLLCALLLVPERRWWVFILAVLPAHIVAEIGVGMPPPQYLIAFATNCMVAILSAFGIRRLVGEPPWFVSLRQAFLYVLIAVVASPAVSALGGAFVRIAGDGLLEDYWTYWTQWYNANALASATLGPVFLTWMGGAGASALAGNRKVEAALLLFALATVCSVAFGAGPATLSSGFLPTLFYLPIPFIVWGAIRFGAVGASGTILIVTIVSIWQNLQGSTMFSADTPEQNVLALQVFLTALSVPALLLGAAIEELQRARNGMQELAGSLLRIQDEERRRVSRELHDKIGQDLAAAHLAVARLEGDIPSTCGPVVAELDGALQRAMRELRAVSYQLHPPLLDEAGLNLALKSYIGGLAKRSGVAVELELSTDLERLPADIEFILFRVIQDAVTNVHRHTGSRQARIELALERTRDEQKIVLTIEDVGDAHAPVPERIAGPQELAGLGLAGMRERLRQIGGRVHVESAVGRTILTAFVPIAGKIGSVAETDGIAQ